jgi:hypothetical protein
MEGHVLRSGLEKLGNLGLCQPERLVFKSALDACAAVRGLIEDDFRLRQGVVAHLPTPFVISVSSPSASFSMARISARISSSVRSGWGL